MLLNSVYLYCSDGSSLEHLVMQYSLIYSGNAQGQHNLAQYGARCSNHWQLSNQQSG